MTDILLFLAGIVVGAINAIAGGGMLLGFPVLLATGMPAIAASATVSTIVFPGNLAAAYGYRYYLRKVPRQYLLLLLPVLVGATIGALLLRNTSHERFGDFIPFLILGAVVLFAFQPFLYRYMHRHIHGPTKLRRRMWPMVITGLAIFPLAIYGGYFGAGLGFILLSFLSFTSLHEHIHRMNALKTVMTTCVAAAAMLTLFSSGLIDWRHGLVMGAGNLVGGYYAAVGSQKVTLHAIRVMIIVFGCVTAAYLALRNY